MIYTEYDKSELDDYFDLYENIRRDTKENCESADNIWEWAQESYHQRIDFNSLDEFAKLAEAAYYSVEDKADHDDWRHLEERIQEHTLLTGGHNSHDHHVTVYLPAPYTKDVTGEFVLNCIEIDLSDEIYTE